MRTYLLICSLLVTNFSIAAEKLVQGEIILPRAHAAPGQVRQIIIKVDIIEGWHIYWKNPGESGLAPEFTWHGDNYDIKKIHWPTPKSYKNAGIINNIYDGEVLFIADLVVKNGIPDGNIKISLDIDFLACKESCIMQSINISQTIRVDSKNLTDTMQTHPLLSKAMDQMPRTFSSKVKKQNGSQFILNLPRALHNKELYFAFDEDGVIMKQAKQSKDNFLFESNDKSQLKGLIIYGRQSWIVE